LQHHEWHPTHLGTVEDLEPRRFDDLVRQLIYGRSGSDDGIDARGFEIVDGGEPTPADDPDDQPEEQASRTIEDRIWQIQSLPVLCRGP
jgi:hypothetical protein